MECYRCHKPLPSSWTETIGYGATPNPNGWHMINAAPHAASGGSMVPVCNKCDPDPLGIKSAELAAVASERERCAKIAESFKVNLDDDRKAQDQLAAAIRAQKQ